MDTTLPAKRWGHVLRHGIVTLLLLIGGCVGMGLLGNMRTPPEQRVPQRSVLAVRTVNVQPTETAAIITGYGTVRALRRIPLSAEVGGRIVYTHPNLRPGARVTQGETLFSIDTLNFDAALEQASAAAATASNRLMQIVETARVDALRLGALERSATIAEDEFKRVADLFTTHRIGAQSVVDRAEQAALTARDAVDLLRLAILTHPNRIEEAESAVRSALARLKQAAADRGRCTIRAPFAGRLTDVRIEAGQYIAPGMPALTLVDDSVLELLLSIPEAEARAWLPFAETEAPPGDDRGHGEPQAWYGALSNVTCRIVWESGHERGEWDGTLHRIVEVNPAFRSVTVAIRISAQAALGDGSVPPLVDGMFCRAIIPGRAIHAVAVLPRWAVTLDNTVFLAVTPPGSVNGQDAAAPPRKVLRTVPVSILREHGDDIYISAGLQPGDEAIITRLIDPLEGVELSIEAGRAEEP